MRGNLWPIRGWGKRGAEIPSVCGFCFTVWGSEGTLHALSKLSCSPFAGQSSSPPPFVLFLLPRREPMFPFGPAALGGPASCSPRGSCFKSNQATLRFFLICLHRILWLEA